MAFALKVSLLGLAAVGLLVIGLGLIVAGVVASDVAVDLLALLWIFASPFVVFGSLLVRSICRPDAATPAHYPPLSSVLSTITTGLIANDL